MHLNYVTRSICALVYPFRFFHTPYGSLKNGFCFFVFHLSVHPVSFHFVPLPVRQASPCLTGVSRANLMGIAICDLHIGSSFNCLSFIFIIFEYIFSAFLFWPGVKAMLYLVRYGAFKGDSKTKWIMIYVFAIQLPRHLHQHTCHRLGNAVVNQQDTSSRKMDYVDTE